MGNRRVSPSRDEILSLREIMRDVRVKLRLERMMRPATQEAIAVGMMSNQSTVAEYENGRMSNPTLLSLARWASALGFDINIQLIRREVRDEDQAREVAGNRAATEVEDDHGPGRAGGALSGEDRAGAQ